MIEKQTQLSEAAQGLASRIPHVDISGFSQAAKLADAVKPAFGSVQKAIAESGAATLASSLANSQLGDIAMGLDTPALRIPDHDLTSAYESLTPNYTIPDHSFRDFEMASSFTQSWHQLIILGNGFDLQCGLHSKFGDFFISRFERIKGIDSYDRATWKKLLDDTDLTVWDFVLEANINDAWCDVEGEMERWVRSFANQNSKTSLFWGALKGMGREDLFTDGWSLVTYVECPDGSKRLSCEEDDRAHLFANIARYSLTLHPEFSGNRCNPDSFIELFRLDLRRLERAFGDYLSREIEDNDRYVKKCEELYRSIAGDGKPDDEDFSVSTSVLSFNYTSVVEDLFDKGEDGAFANIHGKLGEDIIFGIDGKDCMDDSVAVQFTKTYRLMLRGGSRTGGLICTANSSNLQDATDVIKFYGHSLGRADYSYFQSIFDGVDLYESDTTLVFYFPLDASDNAEAINNEWRTQLANDINNLLTSYGATMDNMEHGKNLMHKLLLEGRLIIRGLKVS